MIVNSSGQMLPKTVHNDEITDLLVVGRRLGRPLVTFLEPCHAAGGDHWWAGRQPSEAAAAAQSMRAAQGSAR
jgi:hypothetical protein